ncbi:hypothetical protein ACFX13_046432 [Malus domestica]
MAAMNPRLNHNTNTIKNQNNIIKNQLNRTKNKSTNKNKNKNKNKSKSKKRMMSSLLEKIRKRKVGAAATTRSIYEKRGRSSCIRTWESQGGC